MVKGLKLEELTKKTGISERNIKYWCSEYNLDVIKEGRSNFYPSETEKILILIDFLTGTKLFTTQFINIIVDYNKNRNKFSTTESFKQYKKFISEYCDVAGPSNSGFFFNLKADTSNELDIIIPEKFRNSKTIVIKNPGKISKSSIEHIDIPLL